MSTQTSPETSLRYETSEPRVRILLVDDHALVREGLTALLERQPGIEVVGGVGTARAVLGLEPAVDVVVSEIDLPDANGGQAIRLFTEHVPQASVLVLSAVDHPVKVLEALVAGAAGYLLKTAESAELLAAVRALARGETYLQPSLGVALARFPSTLLAEPGSGAIDRLPPKEIEVLHLLALGYTNAEIATRVGVSVRTVETHRARIGQKLGGRSRADLVREAMRFGLVDTEVDGG